MKILQNNEKRMIKSNGFSQEVALGHGSHFSSLF